MKWFLISILILTSVPVVAEVCDLDATPAATLLLPYFEVGPEVTTVFSIHNGSPEPALAQVTLWTDWGAPTVSFSVFLTGFDVARINLAHVLSGNVPVTADAAGDPDDTVSPHGGIFNPGIEEWDGSFPGCDEILPFYVNPVITGAALDLVANGHTGRPVESKGGACFGADHGDGVARGYVTVDSVRRCDVLTPASPEYFGEGEERVADDRNILWGDYFILDKAGDDAYGDSLVHIEAVDSLDDVSTGLTFYNSYAPDGNDRREPLGTVWGFSYFESRLGGDTEVLVWRDTLSGDGLPDGLPCNGPGPSWFPLNEMEVVAFNDAEDAVGLCLFTETMITPAFLDPMCFPWATGRYTVSEVPLDVPFRSGWMQTNLNHPIGPLANEGFVLAQSHVSVLHRIPGLAAGHTATRIVSACEDSNPFLTMEWGIPSF